MSEQKKLSSGQINRIQSAKVALFSFNWQMTSEGHHYWNSVWQKLDDKVEHGTSDGKPYVEPERWRVPTDEDAIGRPKCRVRDSDKHPWLVATLIFVQEKLPAHYPFCVIEHDFKRGNYRYCEILDTPADSE